MLTDATLIDRQEEMQFLLQEKMKSVKATHKCVICSKYLKTEFLLHFVGATFDFNMKTGMYPTHKKCFEEEKVFAKEIKKEVYELLAAHVAIGKHQSI